MIKSTWLLNHSSPNLLLNLLRLYCLLFALSATTLVNADQLTELLTGSDTEKPVANDKVITTDNSQQDDRDIRQRLRDIFAELDALKPIQIAVNKGVITLTGEIDSNATATKAIQFARQVEGVVEVKNELTINRSLSTRLANTWDKLWLLTKETSANLPLLLIALLILALFWWLGSWLSDKRSVYLRVSPNYFIANLIGQIIHLLFIVLGIVLALILLDATALIGTILGAAGIVGLAVGFAVRDTVENYIASILLSLRNPFEVNDYVSINGNDGNVLRLTSRATVLFSPDGNHIRIPNAVVYKAIITNYTRHPERRFQFDVGVDTEQDLLAAQALAINVLKKTTGVLADPKPLVVIEQLGDSNVLLRIYAWVNQEQYGFQKVRSETIRAIKKAFDEAGIVMPEPIYNLRMLQTAIKATDTVTDRPGTTDTAQPTPDKQAVIVPTQKSIITPEVQDTRDAQDVTPDRTVENKVKAEQAQSSAEDENLLNADFPKE